MSRRKQTNPRAIKRDVSADEDDNSNPIAKKLLTESLRSDSIDSSLTVDNEEKPSTIKCDSCQELFQTSEQFNRHRLYQCSFLPEETNSDDSHTSSYDDFANQIDTIPFGTSQNEEYPHQCSYCTKSFSNMALLLKHEQVHVELMPFRCSFCGKGFKHRRSLNRHSKLHTGERKFKCTLCESTFARSDHLKAHIRTHNNNNNHHHLPVDKPLNPDFQLKLPSTIKSTIDEHSLVTDNKKSREEHRTEHCPYCPRICLGEDSLRSHLQNEHHQKLDESSLSDEPLKSERISPTSSDTYCHLCNAKFNNRENYYAHLRCTHSLIQKQFDPSTFLAHVSNKSDDSMLNEYALIERTIWCEKCKRSFDSMTAYLQHYSFQHCLQIIKCLLCQEIFETLELFFNHIERAHPSKTVETMKCRLCNATYKQRTDFVHHIQTVHKSSSPYSCSICSGQFASTTELIDHVKFTHQINHNHQRRPSFNTLFSCHFCTSKFHTGFELNQHLLHEHHEERKSASPSPPIASVSPSFKCLYCHALFTSRTQLDRHSRIHIASSGNNLKCNICDRLFPTIDTLSEHKLSHCKATTSNICSYCHQTLNHESDYMRHLYEHNHLHHSKNKNKLFHQQNDNAPLTITCIVCKQSLINEHEVDLHAKFHLKTTNKSIVTTKDTTFMSMMITCHQCHRSSHIQRDFLLELPSFQIHCFDCLEKDLKSTDSSHRSEDECVSTSLSCPKCRNDVEFDSIKTYQQHFTSVHSSKHSHEEFHCLKCNKLVPNRNHILQHHSKSSPSSNVFDHARSSRCSSPPRVHYCYLCRTNFDTAIKMHIHLIEHQYPNHDYQCSLCDHDSFDDASQLYHHMVQHGSKARLHPCRECDVFFMFSMHLINHQYSHAEEMASSKINGDSLILKVPCKSRTMLINEEKKQSNDNDDNSCKSIVTRSSTKGTGRSVIVN